MSGVYLFEIVIQLCV